MKRHPVFILCTVGFLLAAAGCVQPGEIEPPEEREVFVKCILMNDTNQQVRLLYTGGIDDSTFVPVEKAEVVVTGPERIDFVFKSVGDGKWEHGFSPRAGATYALHVRIPGREELVATTCFPDNFSIISKASAPARWVADMHAIYEGKVPGASENHIWYQSLFPTALGLFRNYIPGWEEPIHGGTKRYGSTVDFQIFDRIAAYQGTTLQQQMPGLAFRMESESAIRLYILGTITDKQGNVIRMPQLGTNHKRVDRSNQLPAPFRSGIDPSQAAAPIIVDATYKNHQFDIPHNQFVYQQAIRYSYEGQPVFSDYLRIHAEPDYDNGLKLYTIIEEYNSTITIVDSSAIVRPPYIPPGDNSTTPYFLSFTPNGSSYFSIYGPFDYNLWNDSLKDANPSLFFCSVSEEYDHYLQSLREYKSEQDGDVLATLYKNSLGIYSNIEGGYGIFGAAHVRRHDCNIRLVGQSSLTNYISYPAYPAPLPEL